MLKYALGLEYNGSPWFGWQKQPDRPSIQAELEAVLSRLAGHTINTVCAGRTDAGVHALNQVVHFSVDSVQNQREERVWIFGGNRYLNNSIRILWAKTVPEHFNARRSALARVYSYVIYNAPIRPSLNHGKVTWWYRPLRADWMHQAAQYLVGEHDFSAFRDKFCQSHSPIRNLQTIEVRRAGDYIFIDLMANAFLHHMVRNIVGVLLPIGQGIKPVDWASSVLQSRQRSFAGVTASPNGLYLKKVIYPEAYALPTGIQDVNHVLINP